MQVVDRALMAVAGAGLAVALLGVAVWLHQRQADAAINSAVVAERSRWQEAHRVALAEGRAESLAERNKAAVAALEAQIELSNLRQAMERDRALSRAHTGSLQRTIAEFRDRAAREAEGAGPGSLAHGAAAAAGALSECSERRAEVAAVADRLSVQVTGLQRYINEVVGPLCIAGFEDEATGSSEQVEQ